MIPKIPLLLLLAAAVAAPPQARGAEFDHEHRLFDTLLKSHVRDGFVDYAALKGDSKKLNAYLDELAAVTNSEFRKWSKSERLAYLINLYNAQTLRLILDHYGKIKSIKDIGGYFKGPWDMKIVRFLGEKKTLNDIEHKVIRKLYKDPRAHFALVCASIDCPPLREEAYTAAGESIRGKTRLDFQLQDQGNKFMTSAKKNHYDPKAKILYLSPIFKWFKKDFTSSSGSLVSFVLPYLPRDVSRALLKNRNEVSIRFTEYNWNLNDRKIKEIRTSSGT